MKKILVGVIAVVLIGIAFRWAYLRGNKPRNSDRDGTLVTEKAEWGFFLISQVGNPLEDLHSVLWSRLTGLVWARFQNIDGKYNWSFLDEQVQKAQRGGYNLIAELKTGNNNIISDPACYQAILENAKKGGNFESEKALHSCPLKPEYLPRWKTFVRDVIERYDGDGKNDMPGLKPGFVMDIEIENEPANPYYWHFNEKDGKKAARSLLEIMKLAAEARDEANPGTKLILAGLIHPNYLERCATDSGYDSFCSTQYFQRNRVFTEEILKYPQYFDAIDAHFFNYFKFDPYNIGDGMKWLRAEMATRGYSKPIYVLEWTGAIMMPVINEGHVAAFAQYFPYDDEFEDEKDFADMYKNLAAPENNKYRIWFEAEQAREFPKLFTTMLAEGVERMVYVRFSDYAGAAWDNTWWNWQGIVRYTGTFSSPVLVKKPVYYTYQMLEEKLKDYEEVSMLDLGTNIFAYLFTFKDRPPLMVAWTEGSAGTINLTPFSTSENVVVTHIVTELDENDNPVRSSVGVPASAVPITDTPVFVQSVPKQYKTY